MKSFLFTLSIFFNISYAMATELEVNLNINNITYENIKNNEIIGTGYVSNNSDSLISIGSNAERVEGMQDTYVFSGQRNPNHKIFIRLGGKDWQVDKEGNGIISRTKNASTFNLYISGNYKTEPDIYLITIHASKANEN